MNVEIFDNKCGKFKKIPYMDRLYLNDLIKLNESNCHLDLNHLKWNNGECSIDETRELDRRTKKECRKLAVDLFLEKYEENEGNLEYIKIYYNPIYKSIYKSVQCDIIS